MPDFFGAIVGALGSAEIQQLFVDRIPENIRLEYKREVPATDGAFKEEMAKAVSSFANTYGGYFVVGISTDANGNPVAMDGVDPVAGYAQRVVSVGYQDVVPPLMPFVSNAVDLGNGKVVYVVYQELSLEAPHFLTRRRGAYVRTQEFSQAFTPQLATWDELRFLGNRRRAAGDLRESLFLRSRDRAGTILPQDVWRANPTALFCFVTPAFPSRPMCELRALQGVIERSRVNARQVAFPRGNPLSLKDTIGLVVTGELPQYSESTIFGSTLSADLFLEEEEQGVIPGPWVIAYILLRVRHGLQVLRMVGYDGLLHIRVILFRARGKQFVWRLDFGREAVRTTCQEEEIVVETQVNSQEIANDLGPMGLRLFREIAFAAGWRQVFESPDNLLLARALEILLVDDRFLRL